MRTTHSLAAAALLMLLLTGAKPETGSMPDTTDQAGDDYRLGPGDRLRVTVYSEASLSGLYSVGSNGALPYPLLGEIPAAHQSTGALAQMIHDRLAAGNFVKDAKVSVELLTYRPYYILGEVNRPGQYPYVAGLKLEQAIAAAGGYTYRANRGTAYIEHGDDDHETPVKIRSDVQHIRPGDTIRIGERYI